MGFCVRRVVSLEKIEETLPSISIPLIVGLLSILLLLLLLLLLLCAENLAVIMQRPATVDSDNKNFVSGINK